MLRITPVAIEIVRMLQPLIRQARGRERNLAEQLDDCSSAMVANLCEGNAAEGRTRRWAYTVSLREARETVGWLAIAGAKGLDVPDVHSMLDHVIGVLVKNVYR